MMTHRVITVVRHVKVAARLALTVGVLAGGGLAAQAVPAVAAAVDPYTTNFPLTENPISEGGVWLNGKATGLDFSDVRTTAGRAFGTQTGTGATYADSTAILNGTFGSDQEASGTVFNNDTVGDWHEEVELRLRSTMTPNSSAGYEIEFQARADAGAYCDIVRWNGAYGNYTPLVHASGSQCSLKTGDVIRATVIGNVITAYKNGAVAMQTTDGMFTSGNPGMGFFLHNFSQSGNPANSGLTSFSAKTIGTPAATPTPSKTATAAPTSTPGPTATPVPPTAIPAGVKAYATIQAENYTSKAPGPVSETTTDIGGGLDMGHIRNGDWLGYASVNFGATPATQFVARVASWAAAGVTGTVEVRLDSATSPAIGSFTISSTGGYQNWVTKTTPITSTTGTHPVYLVFNSATTGHFVNVNWSNFAQSVSATPTSTPVPPTAIPSGGVNAYATIQAESYTSKAPGPVSETTTDIGGGLDIGYIRSGDWLGYASVNFGSTPATQFVARVASWAATGVTGTVEVHLDSATSSAVGLFTISSTGGYQNWVTMTTPISSTTGTHPVYLVFKSATTGHFVNINWFDFAH
jgi:hypothetical protein